MPDLPKLTEADIRRWIGEPSFTRGLSYYRDGAIFNPRRAEWLLMAQCAGSRAQPYRVQVTLGPAGILAGNCSCPVGAGGACKHTAALLLTWLHDPDEFADVEDMGAALERRSKADLIALIGKMVDRYPDLVALIELPVPGEANARPVNAENIRRQVLHALDIRGDWESMADIAAQLRNVVDIGDGYAEAGDFVSATVIYETTTREVLDQFGSFHDEEGELHDPVNRCVAGLGECLAGAGDPAQRRQILRALFDTYAWDVNYGGIEMGHEATDIIREQATPEERRQIASWVRDALPTGRAWSDDYRRQAFGGFLLDLEQDTLDDETWLRICRETGRVLDLAERLLALGRVDEALEAARSAGDFDVFRLTDIFKARGHLDLITGLMRERAKTSQDTRLAEWLQQQAVARGDQSEALGWAQHLFWQRPSLEGYRQVKALAQAIGAWEKWQAGALPRLVEGKQYGMLTEIYLEEDQIDRALETIQLLQTNTWAGYRWDLVIKVAAVAEETRPRAAIDIYTRTALNFVESRGRDNYIAAAEYLSRVRELYQRLGEEVAWQALIADIRAHNTRLHALKEELARAGL